MLDTVVDRRVQLICYQHSKTAEQLCHLYKMTIRNVNI
jgi:hypothetical protein